MQCAQTFNKKNWGKMGNNETKMKKLKEDQGYRAYIITQPKNDNCLNNVVRFMSFYFFY